MNALIIFFKIKTEAIIESALSKEKIHLELKKLVDTKNKFDLHPMWKTYKGEFIGDLTESGFDVVNKPTFINSPTVKIKGNYNSYKDRTTLYLKFQPTSIIEHIVFSYFLGLTSFVLLIFEYYKISFIIFACLFAISILHFITYKVNCLDSLYMLRKSVRGSLIKNKGELKRMFLLY